MVQRAAGAHDLRERLDAPAAGRMAWVLSQTRLALLQTRYWRTWSDWDVRRRALQDHWLILPTAGSIAARVESWTGTVAPGDALLVTEGLVHDLDHAPGCGAVELVSVHFHWQDAWGRPASAHLSSPALRLTDAPAWHARLMDLIALQAHRPDVAGVLGVALLRTLLSRWAAQDAGFRVDGEADLDRRVAGALQRIATGYGGELDVRDLAREAGLSEVRFRRLFKGAVGRGPKAYLADYRLSQAALLLRGGELSIARIASRCGFRSITYFHQQFRARYGVTPAAYRASGLPL